MKKRTLLLCSLFSIFMCHALKEKPLKSLFVGPLLPYVQTNYDKVSDLFSLVKGPTLFGFAPGFQAHAKYMAENGVTMRYTYRANYAPNGLKKGMFRSRFKDFDTAVTIGRNFFESDHALSNFFAGFGYNRCLVTSIVIGGEPASIDYNTIFFMVGFNQEWEINENWGIGIDIAAKPDINPTASFETFNQLVLPMEYAYALEGALNFAYQKKYKSFSVSVAVMPFVELAVYGRVVFFVTAIEKLTKLLAG